MSLRSLCTRSAFGVLLLVAGAVFAVVAAWMLTVVAGVAVLALVLASAGYTILYVEARDASDRQSASSR